MCACLREKECLCLFMCVSVCVSLFVHQLKPLTYMCVCVCVCLRGVSHLDLVAEPRERRPRWPGERESGRAAGPTLTNAHMQEKRERERKRGREEGERMGESEREGEQKGEKQIERK